MYRKFIPVEIERGIHRALGEADPDTLDYAYDMAVFGVASVIGKFPEDHPICKARDEFLRAVGTACESGESADVLNDDYEGLI